ncbi:Autophagy protein 16 [Erysiphe neolycopersici]|uniref:Autophagy protein 16 n=1 Tax=Erysiphe neolycopersici TaxID=212602 RepID=A0A420HN60_9PEZI|nr:Autophagy protein 16 [Erysiphe neolycopersici]
MTLWRDEYLNALKESEKKKISSYSQIDDQLIDACIKFFIIVMSSCYVASVNFQIVTILLDHTASLEAHKAAVTSNKNQVESGNLNVPTREKEILHVRSELAEALRSNGQICLRTKAAEAELSRLREKNKFDVITMEELSKDRVNLTQKLKDRDEELRGKTKLLDDLYDEIVSLNLQLNMSEQKFKDLKSENQFLVDRWMARKILEWEKTNEGPIE